MGFNESQTRYLVEMFRYLDESLIGAFQSVAGEANNQALCPEFVLDVPVEQQDALKPELAAFRGRLLRFMAEQQIAVEPAVSSINAFETAIGFVEASLEEIQPARLKAYGPMSKTAADALLSLIGDLEGIVARMAKICDATQPALNRDP